jgi:hypothetical protein
MAVIGSIMATASNKICARMDWRRNHDVMGAPCGEPAKQQKLMASAGAWASLW